jgi:hypothetical protein
MENADHFLIFVEREKVLAKLERWLRSTRCGRDILVALRGAFPEGTALGKCRSVIGRAKISVQRTDPVGLEFLLELAALRVQRAGHRVTFVIVDSCKFSATVRISPRHHRRSSLTCRSCYLTPSDRVALRQSRES